MIAPGFERYLPGFQTCIPILLAQFVMKATEIPPHTILLKEEAERKNELFRGS
jgi:hypothetical protein